MYTSYINIIGEYSSMFLIPEMFCDARIQLESSYDVDVVVGDQEKKDMWVNSYKNSCKMACETAILLLMPQVRYLPG